MKYYSWREAPKNLSREEYRSFKKEDEIRAFLHTGTQLDEIKKIFEVQLRQPGDERRRVASEEIIKYLYSLKKESYDATQNSEYIIWDYFYGRTLITIAEIVDAANKNDEQLFAEKLKRFPWGDSSTGSYLASIGAEFAYWILSDENKKKYYDIYFKILKENVYGVSDYEVKKIIRTYASLENLDKVIEANQEYAEKIKHLPKPVQPGNGDGSY